MSKGLEAKLKAECRAWLREQGAYVFSPVQMGYGASTVDDLVCWQGEFIGLEYKRPDTRPKPTPRQNRVLDEIRRARGRACTIYSLDSLRAWLA